MTVLCDYCQRPALLVSGSAIYRNRPDLRHLKFWHCGDCRAYVGCHKNSATHAPLGRLANAELRHEKQAAHAAFDPLWMSGRMERRKAYAWLAEALGIPKGDCHIGMFDEARCRAVAAAVATLHEPAAPGAAP